MHSSKDTNTRALEIAFYLPLIAVPGCSNNRLTLYFSKMKKLTVFSTYKFLFTLFYFNENNNGLSYTK